MAISEVYMLAVNANIKNATVVHCIYILRKDHISSFSVM